MKNEQTIKNWFSQYGYVVGIILVSILFLIRNAISPNISDTLLYHYYYPAVPVENVPHGVIKDYPIQTMNDVLHSQYHHYFNMNGRAIVHTLIQIFCGVLDSKSYCFLAMIMFCLLIWITGRYCFRNAINADRWVYFAPMFLLCALIIYPGCISGIVGGFNYLFSSLLCVAFWYIFTERIVSNKWCLPLAIFSFIVGWSFEGIVLPLGVAIGVYTLFNIKQLSFSKIIMIIFFVIGACFLVFAPGNFVRTSEGLGWTYHSFITYLSELRCFYLLLITLAYGAYKKKREFIPILNENKYLLCSVFVSFIAFSLIKNAPPRVGFGVELWSVILTCSILSKLINAHHYQLIGKTSAVLLSIMLCLSIFYQCKSNQQIEELTTQLSSNNDSICTVLISSNQIPTFIQPSVGHIMCMKEAPTWNIEVWKWFYGKSQISVLFKDEIPIFDESSKVYGSANLYRCANWFYSQTKISTELKVTYHIDYKYNLKYRLLGIYHQLFHHKRGEKSHIISPKVEYIDIDDKYYCRFYNELSPTWIIDSIDLIAEN